MEKTTKNSIQVSNKITISTKKFASSLSAEFESEEDSRENSLGESRGPPLVHSKQRHFDDGFDSDAMERMEEYVQAQIQQLKDTVFQEITRKTDDQKESFTAIMDKTRASFTSQLSEN